MAGVTDAEAREIEAIAARLGLGSVRAATGLRFELGTSLRRRPARPVGRRACSPTRRWTAGPSGRYRRRSGTAPADSSMVETVPLAGLGADELAVLSKARLLSLDPTEMAAIQAFFADAGPGTHRRRTRNAGADLVRALRPQDVPGRHRLRTPARRRDGRPPSASTGCSRPTCGPPPTPQPNRGWCRRSSTTPASSSSSPGGSWPSRSKPTTTPPHLEPFGGANTGVGGVVRDVIGVSARPIACLDVLCFAPPDTPAAAVPPGVLHPRRVAEGVVGGDRRLRQQAGVCPPSPARSSTTRAISGTRWCTAAPSVCCPPARTAPTPARATWWSCSAGAPGRDGIHGATFSSADMDALDRTDRRRPPCRSETRSPKSRCWSWSARPVTRRCTRR